MKKQTVIKLLAVFTLIGCTVFSLSSCFSNNTGDNSEPSYGTSGGNNDGGETGNGGGTENSGNAGNSGGGSEDNEEAFNRIPSEGLAYKLSEDGNSYIVSGTGICFDTDVVIPSTYEEKPVTGIGTYAFQDFTALTSVVIPHSVTTIGQYAFDGCTGLQSVVMGNAVTTIDYCAFDDCSRLTDINIPDSVTSVSWAFDGCSRLNYNEYEGGKYLGNKNNPYLILVSVNSKTLTTYKIHESTKILYSGVFKNFENLVAITIPDSVVAIGSSAFYGCGRLAGVKLGNSVNAIESDAFYYCTSLTSVELPDSVVYVGSEAFYYCTQLKNMDLGNAVEFIGESAFQHCNSLEEIVFPISVENVGKYAFNYCGSLKNVVVSNPNATIGAGFVGCSIETATIVASMLSQSGICNKPLTSLTIIGGEEIPAYAFDDCVNLTEVIISASVTSIATNAFNDCTALTNITVNENNNYYQSIEGNLYTKDGTTLVQYAIGKTDTTFQVPTHVTAIGNEAFYNCLNLKNVEISDSVMSIGDNAFYNGANLESVVIGKAVTEIGSEAFRWCESLTSFTFRGTVTEWNTITKGRYWNYMNNYYCIPAEYVICSNGTVAL